MSVTQYIGARYVPIFADPIEWSSTKQYEPLTIVTHEGNSYTSRQFVPVGVQITDTDYWVETGNYNAQVEQYRQEVLGFNDRIDVLENANDWIDVKNESEWVEAGSKAVEQHKSIRILKNFTTDKGIRLDASFGDDSVFLPYINLCGNTINYTAVTDDPLVTFIGRSGGNKGGGIFNGRIVSTIRNTGTCVKIINSCFIRFIDLEVRSFNLAFNIVNDGAGKFSEFNRFVRVWFAYNKLGLKLEKINNGDTSMHGVSMLESYFDVPQNCLGVHIGSGITVYDATWIVGALGQGKFMTCDGIFSNTSGHMLFESNKGELTIDGGGLFQFDGNIFQEGNSYHYYPFTNSEPENELWTNVAPRFECKNWVSLTSRNDNLLKPIARPFNALSGRLAQSSGEGVYLELTEMFPDNGSHNILMGMQSKDGNGDDAYITIGSLGMQSPIKNMWDGFSIRADGKEIKLLRSGNIEIKRNDTLLGRITNNGFEAANHYVGTLTPVEGTTIAKSRVYIDGALQIVTAVINVTQSIPAWESIAVYNDGKSTSGEAWAQCFQSDGNVTLKHIYMSNLKTEQSIPENSRLIITFVGN